ncbi:hypothetical protein C7474_0485 [Microbacterium telephonicum]|uniref:Uncharacterized protein n=2 Tax=Microbacterium telephonicum TaxID=1714841 RepID=A0A498CBD3_9MICO|nr:hypothetical protein C7474_0485 [Microbacterium telephonicum]
MVSAEVVADVLAAAVEVVVVSSDVDDVLVVVGVTVVAPVAQPVRAIDMSTIPAPIVSAGFARRGAAASEDVRRKREKGFVVCMPTTFAALTK